MSFKRCGDQGDKKLAPCPVGLYNRDFLYKEVPERVSYAGCF